MSYLSVKDELVSLNLFSSRGFWKWYTKVLDRKIYGVGQHSLAAGFLKKKKNSLETLIVIFETFHQRVFSDCMNRRNFEIPVLTENSRLQPASLKFLAKRLPSIIISTIKWLLDL